MKNQCVTEPNGICDKSKQLSRVFRGFRIGTLRLVKKHRSYEVLCLGLVSRLSDSSLGFVFFTEAPVLKKEGLTQTRFLETDIYVDVITTQKLVRVASSLNLIIERRLINN